MIKKTVKPTVTRASRQPPEGSCYGMGSGEQRKRGRRGKRSSFRHGPGQLLLAQHLVGAERALQRPVASRGAFSLRFIADPSHSRQRRSEAPATRRAHGGTSRPCARHAGGIRRASRREREGSADCSEENPKSAPTQGDAGHPYQAGSKVVPLSRLMDTLGLRSMLTTFWVLSLHPI